MGTTEHSSKRTTDHDVIRQWISQRGGRPAVVRDTMNGASGVLRVDFAEPTDSLEEIPWDDFFRMFEENNLTFLYQDETADGHESRFFKFVSREDGE